MSKTYKMLHRCIGFLVFCNFYFIHYSMGSKQSFESPTTHPRFSKVQYSASRESMIILEPLQSKTKQIDFWCQRRKLYQHVYNSPSLFICKDYNIEHNGICSDTGLFRGRYDGVYEKTLKQQIGARRQQRRFFTQEQIWYFIVFISKCADKVYQCGDNHFIGNIHPRNVLISPKGEYNIIIANYSISFPSQLDHFREYQINGDSHAYISPELIGFLYSTKYADYPNYPKCISKQAAQAFSFGLTLISVATLEQDMTKIYRQFNSNKAQNSTNRKGVSSLSRMNKFNLSINRHAKISIQVSGKREMLNELLSSIQNRYSSILYELIVGLIQPDPEARIRIDNAYKDLLKPIQRDILIFDNRWIYQHKQKQQPNDSGHLEHHSKQICQQWVRSQSNILKQFK